MQGDRDGTRLNQLNSMFKGRQEKKTSPQLEADWRVTIYQKIPGTRPPARSHGGNKSADLGIQPFF